MSMYMLQRRAVTPNPLSKSHQSDSSDSRHFMTSSMSAADSPFSFLSNAVYQACTGVPSSGLYFPPTLITGVQTTSKVVVEEIFGPVLVALPFRTAKEAVALANNSIYGLGGSVWSEDLALAVEVARNVKTGTMWINSHNVFDAAAGFGGYKQSGFGRDGGKEGLFEYVKPSWSQSVKINDLDVSGIIKNYGTNVSDRPSIKQSTENGPKLGKPPKIDHTYKLYYGGAQKRPDGNYSRLINDSQGKVFAEVSDSNRKDVRNAVEAAQKSQPGWEKRTGHNKAQILYYIAENLEERKEEFVGRLMKLTGVEKTVAETEVDISLQRLFYWAAYSDKFGGTVQETQMYGTVIKLHEPIGVIGIACPDEYPLLGFVSLFAPAIARGNAVVIIPSEKCPIPALDMYQIFDTSDVPGGVINILSGNRSHITKVLTEHQDIQAMWYHAGDTEGSAFVEYVSAENVKRTWVTYGNVRDWNDSKQGQGEEFLYHSIQVKNIWLPMGEIFAN
ncbi:Aldehyde dehydrogenase family 16 member A1 [Nymphon striatum]|nr:Aldehyde dehydrogenase family 16 member A1 [Nymphon striatum]